VCSVDKLSVLETRHVTCRCADRVSDSHHCSVTLKAWHTYIHTSLWLCWTELASIDGTVPMSAVGHVVSWAAALLYITSLRHVDNALIGRSLLAAYIAFTASGTYTHVNVIKLMTSLMLQEMTQSIRCKFSIKTFIINLHSTNILCMQRDVILL